MSTLNHTLDSLVLDADGRYLSDQELLSLHRYAQSYTKRQQTYEYLRDSGEQAVNQALQKMTEIYPDLMQQHAARCRYDMTQVLRHMAFSILRDDEILFQENMVIWLGTILIAYKENAHCGNAYRFLQEAIAPSLSSDHQAIARPYFDGIVNVLQART